MQDTPEHIKKLQLQIWLAKSPEERLRQAIEDNEALFNFWKEAKAQLAQEDRLKAEATSQLSAL